MVLRQVLWYFVIGAALGLLVAVFVSIRLYTICVSLTIIAILFFFQSVALYMRRWRPARIYENGFTRSGLSISNSFIPWAVASNIEFKSQYVSTPTRGRSGGSSERDVVLKIQGSGQTDATFNIGRTEVERITAAASSQVDKAELVPRWYELQLQRRLIVSALLAFLIAILVGAVATVPIYLTISMLFFDTPWSLLGPSLTGLSLAIIILTIPLFCAILYSSTANGWGRPPAMFRLGVAVLVVISLLLAATLIVAVNGIQSLDYEDRNAIEYPFPGSSGLRMGFYLGQHFDLEEPVSVLSGQALVLENCSVRFNLPAEEDFGFWVEEGGTLELRNTTVTTVDLRPTEPLPPYKDDSVSYLIEVHGSAWIEACVLDLLGGWRDERNDGGLKIFSDDVTVLNTTLTDPYVNGIVTVGCSPTIDGCIVLRAPKDGIQCHGGSPVITGCLVRNCTRGIVLHDADARIEECEVEGGNVGVYMIQSSPFIGTMGVKGTKEAAVVYDHFSDPNISNLILMENERGVVKDRWVGLDDEPLAMQMDGLCIPLFLVVGLLSLVPFLRGLRRGWRHTKDLSSSDSEDTQPHAR